MCVYFTFYTIQDICSILLVPSAILSLSLQRKTKVLDTVADKLVRRYLMNKLPSLNDLFRYNRLVVSQIGLEKNDGVPKGFLFRREMLLLRKLAERTCRTRAEDENLKNMVYVDSNILREISQSEARLADRQGSVGNAETSGEHDGDGRETAEELLSRLKKKMTIHTSLSEEVANLEREFGMQDRKRREVLEELRKREVERGAKLVSLDLGSHKERLSHSVRKAMRSVPHPVAIITSSETLNEEGASIAHRGLTVSSFNTVTLDPTPIVSFNIKAPSSTYDAIQKSKKFIVHIPAANLVGSRMASLFANPSENPFDAQRDLLLEDFQQDDSNEPPLLQVKAAFSFAVHCDLLKEVNIGDHYVVFGKATGISHGETSKAALAYMNGAYAVAGGSRHLNESGVDPPPLK